MINAIKEGFTKMMEKAEESDLSGFQMFLYILLIVILTILLIAFYLVVIVLIIGTPLGLSWIVVCGIMKLITLCFGLEFSWAISTGIWLILALIIAVIRALSKKGIKGA